MTEVAKYGKYVFSSDHLWYIRIYSVDDDDIVGGVIVLDTRGKKTGLSANKLARLRTLELLTPEDYNLIQRNKNAKYNTKACVRLIGE